MKNRILGLILTIALIASMSIVSFGISCNHPKSIQPIEFEEIVGIK